MPEEPGAEKSPADFLGNFQGYIEKIQEELEAQYGDDAGPYESVAARAAAEAQFTAAQNWLVERWGTHFVCPVCGNTEWTVSGVGPAIRPVGFLSFYVTCGYCGNTMHIVPGRADQDAPIYGQEQSELPEK
jgi:hypothetical protein